MGQRLNIEIISNGKTLANAYYHWSAYSSSSAKLAQHIIKNIGNINEESELLKAIRLLELTGAGMTENEVKYARQIEELKEVSFVERTGRNNGLIAISDKGISETRNWQEYALYIYLDEQRMSYKVFWDKYSWEYEKDCDEYKNYIRFEDLDKIDINFDDIKFKDIDEFVLFVKRYSLKPFRINMNPHKVFEFIE